MAGCHDFYIAVCIPTLSVGTRENGDMLIIKNNQLHTSDDKPLQDVSQIRQFGASNKIAGDIHNNPSDKFQGNEY